MVLHNAYGHSARRAYGNELVGDIGDAGTTVRVALLDAAHTPALNTNETFDDVSANEVSGTGYTAGGEALTTKSLTSSGGVTTFDADDVTWSSSTISAGYAVVYEDTGTATTSSLLTLVDFEGEESSDAGDFTISWDASGIFTVTA